MKCKGISETSLLYADWTNLLDNSNLLGIVISLGGYVGVDYGLYELDNDNGKICAVYRVDGEDGNI